MLSGRAATIETVAGTGQAENNGDKGPARAINVKDPFGVEIGPAGALFITEVGHHRIRRVDLETGEITTVAGTGAPGYSGDGGPATEAQLNEPYEVRFDRQGNMFFVEMQNHIVRRVDAQSGIISTVAGSGSAGFRGDGGPAVQAEFRRPHSIALDGNGGLYIADIGNHRIRLVHLSTGVVETIVGDGQPKLPVAGTIAQGKSILGPRALFISQGELWIALREGNSVWKLELKTGVIQHVAGTGKRGTADGAGDQATFNGPKGIAIDAAGDAYVADTENQVIRRIDGQTRSVSTVVGSGQRGPAGDGGDALEAQLARPHGICVDARGRIYIGDTLNHRVRRTSSTE